MQVLNGRVRWRTAETSWEGRSGDLIVIAQERHTLLALEGAAVLLTVAKAEAVS